MAFSNANYSMTWTLVFDYFTCTIEVITDAMMIIIKQGGKEIAEANPTILVDTDSRSTATTYVSQKSGIHIRRSSKSVGHFRSCFLTTIISFLTVHIL